MTCFREVEPIPRGRAELVRTKDLAGTLGPLRFFGGPPRCPVCLRSGRRTVCPNGKRYLARNYPSGTGFHCNRCRAAWRDSDLALCFVCDSPFLLNVRPRAHRIMHLGPTDQPFCARCAAIIGNKAICRRRVLLDIVAKAELAQLGYRWETETVTEPGTPLRFCVEISSFWRATALCTIASFVIQAPLWLGLNKASPRWTRPAVPILLGIVYGLTILAISKWIGI